MWASHGSFRKMEILQAKALSCYGFRLKKNHAQSAVPPASVLNRVFSFCPEQLLTLLFWAMLFSAFSTWQASAQIPHSNGVPEDKINIGGIVQDSKGEWTYLRSEASVETTDFKITADEIDYNKDTDWAYARGHVHFEHFVTGEKLNADHVDYNLKSEEGKFYVVNGTSPAKVMASPGLLTTTNPFYFEGMWAQRIKDRYVIHSGFITDCLIPKPWWTFSAPLFDIIPGERAIGHHTLFRLKRVPLFYLPVFYRPLGKNPRKSGFLTPNIGNSSNRGYMIGGGYYWAINRSYDTEYTIQYFTLRGPAHTFDIRGKPNDVTDFNFLLYGVQDKGLKVGNTVYKDGGAQFTFTGRTEFDGFYVHADYNYLSSYKFRSTFSQSFVSAVTSEVDSSIYAKRYFDSSQYSLTIGIQRNQLYEDYIYDKDQVITEKLPYIDFASRDKQVLDAPLPVYVSFGSTAALVRRDEPTFQTGYGTDRLDIQPRVMTVFNYKGLSLVPSLSFEATQYGNSYASNNYTQSYNVYTPGVYKTDAVLGNSSLFRHDLDFGLDLHLPPIERVFTPPKWAHLGKKVKHVIEARASYEYVNGIDNFNNIIRFDETDIVSNTNQLELSLTNRLYKKDDNGNVSEILSWQVLQRRYFDPTFSGAVQPGQRNVVLAAEEVTPFAFLDGPRNYSPIVSSLRLTPLSFVSVEWRTDYDPVRHSFIDDSIGADFRKSKYFVTVGDTDVNIKSLVTLPGTPAVVLTPDANQIRFGGGYGSTNRRGWNAAITDDYDFLAHQINFQLAQVSYNTNCCGFSVQYRRFAFGSRNENQFLMSLSLANIGMFGSLQKQERIF